MGKVLDHCMYNDNLTSRTFFRSLCFYLIKTRPPLFNSAIKQTERNRWGEPTSWSAAIWGATFPDLLPFGESFFPPKAFLIGYAINANLFRLETSILTRAKRATNWNNVASYSRHKKKHLKKGELKPICSWIQKFTLVWESTSCKGGAITENYGQDS